MADGVIHHVLQDEFRVQVVVVYVGNLDDHAGHFSKEDPEGILSTVGLADIPYTYVCTGAAGGHFPERRKEAALPYRDAGLDHAVFHQFPHHFITVDCYEVVRELVEDGVVKAGVTVGEGGLLTALREMAAGGTGADVCIRDICKAYGGENPLRVLFGEVPGVVIQIADIDYDYLDAELILQDVVYYPIGHPVPGRGTVQVTDQVEIPQILESLLNTLEGED